MVLAFHANGATLRGMRRDVGGASIYANSQRKRSVVVNPKRIAWSPKK